MDSEKLLNGSYCIIYNNMLLNILCLICI